METYDVVVIGGGAAGAAAALSAAGAGARVLLVRRGPGATALAHGGWTAAPPGPVREALARAGLELVAPSGALPHPDGTLVRCELAGASHARASIPSAGYLTLVCGIEGVPSFRPRALAALWSDEAGLGRGVLEPATVTLAGTPAAGWSPVSLAALLEREPVLLGLEVSRAARERGAARAIVPAVLGLDDHPRVLAAVGEAAGVPVGEALGVAPSVPGWRLDRALLRALAAGGVTVIAGRVTGGARQHGVLRHVTVAHDAGSATFIARAFVLASGKYLGGGITAESAFEESALGFDVAIERFARTIDDPGAALILTDPARGEPQPVLAAGVRVDAAARPLTAAGRVDAANVFVAGSVRSGAETATLGLGAAAHEGWSAGRNAAAFEGS